MSGIEFQIMGSFCINIQNSEEPSNVYMGKKGSLLITHLILSYPDPVPIEALSEALSFNRAGGDPLNALKTLISRTRGALNKICPELGGVISSKRGFYSWKPFPYASVDLLELEAIFASIAKNSITAASAPHEYERLIGLYRGDLCGAGLESARVENRRNDLHEKYLSAVCEYIAYLRSIGDTVRAANVCRSALSIDGQDKRLHKYSMDLAIDVAHAIPEYDYNSSIQKVTRILDQSVDEVISELSTFEQSSGAFICAYEEFKDICDIQYRFVDRTGATMFIALIGVKPRDGAAFDSTRINGVSRCLVDTLTKTLRKGDAITQLAPLTYAVSLPMVDYSSSRMVLERVKKNFYDKNGEFKDALFNYRTQPFARPVQGA